MNFDPMPEDPDEYKRILDHLRASAKAFDEQRKQMIESFLGTQSECKPPKKEKKHMKRLVRLLAIDQWAPNGIQPIVHDQEVLTRHNPDKAWAHADLKGSLDAYNADLSAAAGDEDAHQAELEDLVLKALVITEFDGGLLG